MDRLIMFTEFLLAVTSRAMVIAIWMLVATVVVGTVLTLCLGVIALM